jgi:iron complex transport system ATP-binding protein
MLSAKNITYTIGSKILLNDVSVDFEAGKLNLIIGPNGAGKSTLIKIISNEIKPAAGSIFYETKNIRSFSLADLARIRAVPSQKIELDFPLCVKEIVMMGRYPHFTGKATPQDETACEEAMRFFNVLDLADRNYVTLSGGEKQRVHFSRVVSQIWYPVKDSCRYLILDEPLTFLDIRYQFDFMHKVLELLQNKELVVIGVVHDLNLAARFADKIILLNNGGLLAKGNKDEVLTKENITAAYKLAPVIHRNENNMYIFFN